MVLKRKAYGKGGTRFTGLIKRQRLDKGGKPRFLGDLLKKIRHIK